jgi:DNA-binding NtrC family response regulator
MPWPGNVAQLENVVRRAFLQAGGAAIDERHLSLPALAVAPVVGTAPSTAKATDGDADEEVDAESIVPFEEEERRILARALRATGGKVRPAAQLLGIGRATLYRKIQQFGLPLH